MSHSTVTRYVVRSRISRRYVTGYSREGKQHLRRLNPKGKSRHERDQGKIEILEEMMSKKTCEGELRGFHVALKGLDRGENFRARGPKEAVRKWCESKDRDYWRWNRAGVIVRTEVFDPDLEYPHLRIDHWTVDPSQPPAWIIRKAKESELEEEESHEGAW